MKSRIANNFSFLICLLVGHWGVVCSSYNIRVKVSILMEYLGRYHVRGVVEVVLRGGGFVAFFCSWSGH